MYLRVLEILSLLLAIVLFGISKSINFDATAPDALALYLGVFQSIGLFLLLLAVFCLIVWSYHTRLGLSIGMLMLTLLLRKTTLSLIAQDALGSSHLQSVGNLKIFGLNLHLGSVVWFANIMILILAIYVVLLFLSSSFIQILFGLARDAQTEESYKIPKPNLNKYSAKK